MIVSFTLNGRKIYYEAKPNEYLLDTLRSEECISVRRGCDTSSCGVCTVLVDDKPMLSCSILTLSVEGKSITTVEGIQDEIEVIADLFGHEGADQCGFCNSGLALTIYAMKKELKSPTDEDIKHYILGNLCRCSGYQAQFKAIKDYLGVKK